MEMHSDSEKSKHERTEAERFSTYLSELKKRGSALLVVGELPRDSYSPFCDEMLGNPSSKPRYRLRVTTHDDSTATCLENPISASSNQASTTRIVSTFNARSAAKASAVATETDAVKHVDGGSLPQLGIAISQEIQTFNDQGNELQPAELRVCFDSLRPLLEEYEEEQIFRFLDLITNRIRSRSGMGHFHLPLDPEDRLVRTFADIFDAVIKLDTQRGQLVQCWDVQNRSLTSGWISV